MRVLEEYQQMVEQVYKQKLTEDDHFATGDLINKMRYHIKQSTREVEVDLELKDYWKYVENGTKPHWPPIDAILKWVKVKHILPSNTYNGKLPTEKQLAYLISRKISEKGTEGTHDLRETLQQVNNMFEQRIGEAIAEDIDGALTAILTEFQTQ